VVVIGPEDFIADMFTYHGVDVGRPVSVNVTLYRTGENVIATGTGFPLTSNDEVYVGEYDLFCVDTENV
jgi:hypothetical protein